MRSWLTYLSADGTPINELSFYPDPLLVEKLGLDQIAGVKIDDY